MIVKGTLSRAVVDEELEWFATYFNKDTGHNTRVPLYPKDIPYLEIENLKENSEVKISLRYHSKTTGFLFPVDTEMPQKFIDNGQYHKVAKIIFVTHKVKYKTVISKITGVDDDERLLWDEFYQTLDRVLPADSTSLTYTVKQHIETYYKPPIKK